MNDYQFDRDSFYKVQTIKKPQNSVQFACIPVEMSNIQRFIICFNALIDSKKSNDDICKLCVAENKDSLFLLHFNYIKWREKEHTFMLINHVYVYFAAII